MRDDRMEEAFVGLRGNVPHAPKELVDRMVRTVNAMEMERARRAGIGGPSDRLRPGKTIGRNMSGSQPKAPELKKPKAPGR